MLITEAEKTDLSAILQLQYKAYQSEAELYNDYEIQPLRQSLKEIEEEFEQCLILKAVRDDRIIGSVRATVLGETCKIGKLIVDPYAQNQGIGTALMKAVEKSCTNVKRLELYTGYKSEKNLHLYEKLGFKAYKQEKVHERLSFVYLCKDV
ncbi:GNAT family N-acetyltransferase [Paenibacillus sp. J5C_2022]|uniref:GNAT family N-acetyltransferase n=1 Tax=Paenibacillus sp. J5C2022 TaxID=2977129 RepID=UPI0021CE18F6|nr:GNAT family N-acetyltransferase [Paenibacillus sp. J5C2022]MCU6713016.1 GNAT family N-acetyltransferase [Paenibacillus sp. J5C2022]